jgi:cell division transport system permease protein
MIPASSQPERHSIGLAKIWGEGEAGHRVSFLSFTRHIIRRAFGNLRRSPLTVALSVITISVALFLLSTFSLVLHNCALAVSKEGGELMVMVFLKDSASKADIERLSAQMGELMPGGKVAFTDKAMALKNFRSLLGDDAAMLEGLEQENPLPASLDMQAVSAEQAESLFEEVSARFKREPAVESVRYSRGGVQQLKKILSLVRTAGIAGVVFLLVITGFIIANTIRLALYGHRTEIEIMQLVGARRAAIAAPYVIEGLLQGVLGAIVAIGATFILFVALRSFMAQADALTAVFPSFEFLGVAQLSLLLGAGAVVGMTGSFLAVRRFLSES